MAEGGEGGGKAGDLYLGVVDLFAVLLPGSILTGVAWKVLTLGASKDLLTTISGPEFVPKWLIFLIVAYISGHFLFAMGAWIMDPLYDGFYKRWFEVEEKKELPSMRRRADRILYEVLEEKLYSDGDNRLRWSEAFLTASGPGAKTALDRLEADSKFFRSLAVVTMLSMAIVFSPLTHWLKAWQEWVLVGISVVLLLIPSIARVLRGKKEPKESADTRIKFRLLGFPEPRPKKHELPTRLSWTDAEWLSAEAEENSESLKRFLWDAWIIPMMWTIWLLWPISRLGWCLGWFAGCSRWVPRGDTWRFARSDCCRHITL